MPIPKPVNRRPWDAVRKEFEKDRIGRMLTVIPATVGFKVVNPSRWSRIRKSLAAIGIQYWEDLQHVYPEEISQHDGLGPGAITTIKIPMPQGFSIGKHLLRSSGVIAPVERRDSVGGRQEQVHHPSHYSPGPFEVYKVLAHFNIMHGFIQQAIIYLARAHKKGQFAQDVAKAAKWIELTLETGAGLSNPVYGYTRHMQSKDIATIAVEHWGVSGEVADVIDLLAQPWLAISVDGSRGDLAQYTPQLFQAYQRLLAIGTSK